MFNNFRKLELKNPIILIIILIFFWFCNYYGSINYFAESREAGLDSTLTNF